MQQLQFTPHTSDVKALYERLDRILVRRGLLLHEIDQIADDDDRAAASLLRYDIETAEAAKAALRKAKGRERLQHMRQVQAEHVRMRYARLKEQVRDALLADPHRNRRALARSLAVCPSTLYKAIRELIREGAIPAPAPFERGSVKSSHTTTTTSPTAHCPRCGFLSTNRSTEVQQ